MKKLFFILVSIFLGIQTAQSSVDPKKAEVFMNNIGGKVINLLTDKSITDQQRVDQFQQILDQSFDIKAGAKFVLGRYWKQASEEQKKEFLNLFKETTVASYATRFKEFSTQKFEITGSRMESDGGVIVLSKIIRPNGPEISIDWKIFEKNGEMRIYDVVLEGISMSVTLRSEYAAVIQQGGGQIQALIKALEKKLHTYTTK